MTNSAKFIQKAINVSVKKLGTATCFKFLESIVSGEGSKPEVLSILHKPLQLYQSENQYGEITTNLLDQR